MFISSNFRNNLESFSDAEVRVLFQQHEMVSEFFKRDGAAEIIDSMNALIEAFLFSENLKNVTMEMRIHIVNQLRVVTLISKLGETAVKW